MQSSGKYPCAVCRTGVGTTASTAMAANFGCIGNAVGLTPNPDYRCERCIGNARPVDGRPQNEVQVGHDKLEVVASFCYLSDMLSASVGCEIAVTTHVKTA